MSKGNRSVSMAAILIVVSVSLVGCLSGQSGKDALGKSISAMDKPAYDYVEGWYDKNVARMKQGLHPDLAKRSMDPGSPFGVQQMDRNTLLDITGKYGGQNGPNRRVDVEMLDVQGNIATVKVTSNDYVDYAHMIYWKDQWWIINVLWEFEKEKPRAVTAKELAALKKPIYDYVEGWYDKDPERMERGLHPSLAKRSLNPESRNGIDQFTRTSLIDVVDMYGGPGGPERIVDIEILDVRNNIASAKVTTNNYIDYVHLCYWKDQWWVLNVLWCFKS